MARHYENNPESPEREIRVVNLSVVNFDSVFLGKALEEVCDVPVKIRMCCGDSQEMDADEESFLDFMMAVRGADFVIGRFHGDESMFKKYPRMKEVLDRNGTDMIYLGSMPEFNSENRGRFKHSDSEYNRLMALCLLGGEENNRSVCRWLCSVIGGRPDVEVPPPAFVRTEGLHEKFTGGETDGERYLRGLDPSRPTVAVMLHQATLTKGRAQAVEDLIESLTGKGANVVPVFFESSPNEFTGSLGIRKTIEKYLYLDGRPAVDCAVLGSSFSQLAVGTPGAGETGGPYNFFKDLGVPLIQGLSLLRDVGKWEEDIYGLTSVEIGTTVIWPEFDGQIISVPLSFSVVDDEGRYASVSVADRIDRIASLAIAWAELRRTPPAERRIAILLNMYPPTNDRVGGAAGLDSFESIRRCMILMREQGYSIDHIPGPGNELVSEVLAGVTSDLEWVPEGEIAERAADMVGVERYTEWFDPLSDKAKEGIRRSWGDPPGIITTHGGEFVIPGIRNGNLFIGIQPNRGQHEQAETLYHDPRVVMPHQYLAYYRWLRDEFKAHCVVHMGTHGTLEWLPGKGNGLSRDCYPDVILDTMPNVYPYIIDDPGEGVQAKRRTNSVLISYMCPAMTRAGGYDELMDLDGKLQEYLHYQNTGLLDKCAALGEDIFGIVQKIDMLKELGLEKGCSVGDVTEKIDLIYDYVSDLKDAMIKDGLHILGEVPEGERLMETVYSLCRLRNGSVASLRGSVAAARGLDLDELLDKPSAVNAASGRLNGALTDEVDRDFNLLLDGMRDAGFDAERSVGRAREMFGELPGGMEESISYVCGHTYPSVMRMSDETDSFMTGIGGGYVPPGPSGSPTRGNAHLLPTGTNFYSIDPSAVPSEASWRVGSKMAGDMVARYVEDNGRYPESIGIVVWATDTMKTCGDDVAYIMSLMGVKPTWGSVGGKVTGMELIPLSELGRPRIDVTCRISGLFRDSFPNLSDMISDAYRMISELDESDEENYYKKHLKEDMKRYIREGMSAADADDMSRLRIFGDPPGQHGNGVSVLIASSKWETLDQIAETYATWGAYAYGGKWKGQKVTAAFKSRMGALDVTVKNHNDREYDMLDIDDDYDCLGGMNASVRTFGGHMPYSVIGDSSDVDRLKTRTLDEETAYVMRSRVLNPKWFEGLKPHGYKGAMEMSKLTEYMLGWSATSGNIDEWMFQAVTDKYLFDEENRKWIDENNPYALREMLEDMLEAISRDLWDAPEDVRERLRELYLESEGRMEELSSGRPPLA
ncbi:MAG: cobaltochelatase subunit CobN [Candidatus Methanoplasma sp.]|jgi:cobaltochelatase CobN|nr:cobaltochelatase subunit CobN [Candidatus Methanoplasma sp.]